MKRLLVVLTTSPGSRLALVEAIAFAKKTGARVRLLRVANVVGVTARRRADAWLDEMAEHVPPHLRDGASTVSGRAPEAIATEVGAYAPDGVVLAARAYRALRRSMPPDATFEADVEPKLILVWKVRSSPPRVVSGGEIASVGQTFARGA